MGRTVPSFRSALDEYVERLKRVAMRVQNEHTKKALEELLSHVHDLENEFVAIGGTPEEEVFLSLVLFVYSRKRSA